MPKPISDPLTRFWPKVEKTETCWNWIAQQNAYGYGVFSRGGRAAGQCLAHRYSWELASGPILEGKHLDHMCHNPACVNPEHLRVVDNKQNHENFKGAFSTSGTGVRGVSWDKTRGLFRAAVVHNYKQVQVGRFETLEEATEAVKAKRLELFTHNLLDRV
jgi:hypothetical protein